MANQNAILETRSLMTGFAVLLFLSSLEAYCIFGIPIQHLANLGWLLPLVIFRSTLRKTITSIPLFVGFLVWALGSTTYNLAVTPGVSPPPGYFSSSIVVFIGVRFFVMLSFLGALHFAVTLARKQKTAAMFKAIALVGVIASLYALYVYYAQLHGGWEFPRSRAGTSGNAQATIFTYPFHRAMGTFREPSHMAEWLIFPFFSALALSGWFWTFSAWLILSTVLLSGSLTGIIGIGLSIAGMFFYATLKRAVAASFVLRFIFVVSLSLATFNISVHYYNADYRPSLIQLILKRTTPSNSNHSRLENRAPVFNYASQGDISMIGSGVGLAHTHLSRFFGSSVVASFLSLYFNALRSTGYVGLVLLVAFMCVPALRSLRFTPRSKADISLLLAVIGGYFGWLVTFAVHAEELSTHFALIMGTFVFFTHNISFLFFRIPFKPYLQVFSKAQKLYLKLPCR